MGWTINRPGEGWPRKIATGDGSMRNLKSSRRRRVPSWLFVLALGMMMMLSGFAQRGGLMLYEIGSPEVGLAAAGWAARAQDAATAFTNPAGMTKLERSQLLVGTQLIFPSIHFNVKSGTDGFLGPSGETGNAGIITPRLSGFYVHKLSDKWRLGVSMVSYFGLGIDYGDAWAGRYYLQKALLLTAALVPAAAYKVNDWLSVGAG